MHNLIAKNDYEINHNLLLDFNIYEILTKSIYSSNPNVGFEKRDNIIFVKSLKPILKGDSLTIKIDSSYLIKDIGNLQKGGYYKKLKNNDINDFFLITKKIIQFIEKKEFKSNDIRKFKKEINSNKFLKVNNKTIYQVAKILTSRENLYQIGGNDNDGMTNNVEVLPNVEVGSFIHHPQSITFTQKIDKLHLLLDLIGIVPVYGIAADIVNFLLYFVRGEYSDAFYSLICMIPTVGSLIGLSAKYIEKLIFNRKNQDYRKYYNSMKSLKDITKELRIVENKNINLDDIVYQDEDNIYEP